MSDPVDRIAAALLAWPPHPPMAEGTARQMAQRVAAELQLTEETANLCGNDEYAPRHMQWSTGWFRIDPQGDHSCPHPALPAAWSEVQPPVSREQP